jgi:hypothetical protein
LQYSRRAFHSRDARLRPRVRAHCHDVLGERDGRRTVRRRPTIRRSARRKDEDVDNPVILPVVLELGLIGFVIADGELLELIRLIVLHDRQLHRDHRHVGRDHRRQRPSFGCHAAADRL